jgi:hypothetical protein
MLFRDVKDDDDDDDDDDNNNNYYYYVLPRPKTKWAGIRSLIRSPRARNLSFVVTHETKTYAQICRHFKIK